MKLKKTKKVVLLGLLLSFMIGTNVMAYDNDRGGFTFNFSYGFTGSTDFKLVKQKTYCVSSANTYNSSGVYSKKQNYRVALCEDVYLGKVYKGSYMAADTNKYTTNYGSVSKSTYNVALATDNDNLNAGGIYIKGSGTIYQNNN